VQCHIIRIHTCLTERYPCSNNENGRFIYGVASSPGKRASMEDFYEARIDDVDGEKIGMFGVYDGMYSLATSEVISIPAVFLMPPLSDEVGSLSCKVEGMVFCFCRSWRSPSS
jgi:serine/threonine protein phosphatase PrpC